jgi:replicative DNA helicase
MNLYNSEAEKAILGCLIVDNNLIKKAQTEIKPEYFNSTENKKIFEAIIKLFELHKVVDIITLSEFDIAYIADLYNSVMTTANINHYIKILINMAIRREIIKASENIRNIAINEEIDDIETVKSESLSVLNKVSLPECKKPKRRMMEIVSDTLTKLEKAYLNQDESYYKWNINWLQAKTGGLKAGYYVLAARPSIGKTSLALQLGRGIANQGGKVAIFSLETLEDELTNIMICNKGNIDNKYFKTPALLNDDIEIWSKIGRSAAELSELSINIYDDLFFIEQIVLKINELIVEEGLDLVIIDYLQLIETRKKTSTENEKVSFISRQLKKLQQQNGLPILVLSQFGREMEKQKRAPVLSDLRDSGSIEQDASAVWFLHVDHDFKYEEGNAIETQLIIAKQKNGARNIKTKLKFYGNTQRFYDN